jgi:hypothetical protein
VGSERGISNEFEVDPGNKLRARENRFQFYVFPTHLVNSFSEEIILTLVSWYQVTLGMVPEGRLGTDHQKLAIMHGLLLKNSYGCALISKVPLLWEKRI